jgi:hypothetical protein
MLTRKIIPFALLACLMLALVGCGGDTQEVQPATLGQTMAQSFQTQAALAPDLALEDLVQSVTDDAQLPFEIMTLPVEEGLLTGFGNTVISGFQEAVVFGPVVSTVPFVGYVFRLAEDTDGDTFASALKDAADPSWNVCTTADETVVEQAGDLVFFLMCPSSLEE